MSSDSLTLADKIDGYSGRVEPFHVDFTGRMFLGILGNHLLNAAGNHSQRRGWGIAALNKSHYTWVLSRLTIELEEMPLQNEEFEIKTWVEGVMKLFTSRNFSILRHDGTAYGYARSIWAMIDVDTRKPCDLLTLYDGDILRYVVDEADNHCPIAGYGRFRYPELKPVRTIDTYYSDVDVNGHINSIKYVEHVLDLFPREMFQERNIHRFEIAYKTEAYMGDRLTFYRQDVGMDEVGIEIRKNDTETVCQVKICFK